MSLASQRQATILERVRAEGYVQVTEVARELNVSEKTARRDLLRLEERGYVARVHGGARAVGGSPVAEPTFQAKALLQAREKAAIAEAVRRFIEPGMAIGMSAGTTTFEVARRLVDVPRLAVFTNSLPIATFLHAHGRSDLTLMVTGGMPTPTDALVGPLAQASIEAVHLDVVIISGFGIDARSGVSTPNMLEADTDRALAAAGRQLLVVADHTKWGSVGVSSKVPLEVVDVLITDEGLPEAARTELGARVRRLVIAAMASV